MRKLLRNLGIIALIAMMGLMMMACPPEEEPGAQPKGELFIKAGAGGPFTNQVLNAKYEVDPTDPDWVDVIFVWFKATDQQQVEEAVYYVDLTNKNGTIPNIILTNGESVSTYTPTTTGKLIVAAYEKTAYNTAKTNPGSSTATKLPIPLISPEFEVKAKGNDTEDIFFGNWKTTAQFKPAGSPDGTQADENLVIDYITFKLTSTYSTTGTAGGSDTHNSGFERIFWDIVYNDYNGAPGWTKLAQSALPATYDVGYQLTVDMYENWGYTPFTSFKIYKKTTPNSGTTMTISRTNAGGTVVRDYNKQ